jgi:hypothetical protein
MLGFATLCPTYAGDADLSFRIESFMDAERIALLRDAFDAYLNQLTSGHLEPDVRYLPYDFPEIEERQWEVFGGVLVHDELHEITNNLNHWLWLLKRWHAWNIVTKPYSERDTWLVRRELVESLVHQCLLQPSTTRDVFTLIATNSVHQVRLASEKEYRDYLPGDPRTPNEKPKQLNRHQKEKRLASLTAALPGSSDFLLALSRLNDEAYRHETTDYRNQVSHAIGPRLGLGVTNQVTRSIEQAEALVEQPDGTWIPTPIPGKVAVSYAFGGMDPLDMERARTANVDQYLRARACYSAYCSLLASGMALIPRRDGGRTDKSA